MTRFRSLSTLFALLLTNGCALVAGTSDYEPCGDGEGGCDDGSGAGASSSGSGPFQLSIRVSGNVEVYVDGDDGLDVDDDSSRSFTLPAGTHTLAAYCDQSGGEKGPPVNVHWGNAAHCEEPGESCSFSLQKNESFVVSPVDGNACP